MPASCLASYEAEVTQRNNRLTLLTTCAEGSNDVPKFTGRHGDVAMLLRDEYSR